MNNNALKNAKIDAVLDAAGAEILKRGYLKTSTKSIASAANITEKTLFQYFSNKLDILKQLIARQYMRLAEKLREQVADVEDVYEQYLRFSVCYTQEIEAHREFFNRPAAIYRGLTRTSRSEENPALQNPVIEVLIDIVQKGVESRRLPKDIDSLLFVYTYFGSIDYLNRSYIFDLPEVNPEKRHQRMMDCAKLLWSAAEQFNAGGQGGQDVELMARLSHIADELQLLGNSITRR
ncbi:hypothetical protein R50073_40840 [Maricurvus nonylphenolicus]|uniref:TetR/AcrR family transcriptional regulator n=1 Tax=Maricurvus nonylphenolicus TaxID=1008307 RepID=UPI0036F29881